MVKTRGDWLKAMLKTADPVLLNLRDGKLREKMPVGKEGREPYTCLEAFGRTLMGLAPWLELEGGSEGEAALREEYRLLVRKCLGIAVDPASPDAMNFSEGYGQSLVDAAFLADAVVRAPAELSEKLDPITRGRLISALMSTRKFRADGSNWVLFPAAIEAGIKVLGGEYIIEPVLKAADRLEKWYLGDGVYGDGELLRNDYYNSFVIQPLYIDVLKTFCGCPELSGLLDKALKRERRYAAVLERLIAPDGTYPIVGRSSAYRYGAFHALSHAALYGNLPESLPPEQVRCALSTVISRTLSCGIFDENGFLKIGISGAQPSLGEFYISTGSLYLCETVFLPLGLPESSRFWSGGETRFTSQKIWSGEDVPTDFAED